MATEENTESVITFLFTDTQRKYRLDVSELTMNEQVALEELFDRPLQSIYESGWFGSAKGMMALASIARARREPGFSFGDARELFKDVEGEEAEEEPRPTKTRKTAGSQS